MRVQQYEEVGFRLLIDVVSLDHQTDSLCDVPLGAHLITPRRGYLHHGIYVGGESVVHYSGSTRGLRCGPVEEIALDQFTCGQTVWVRSRTRHDFDPEEVVRRARSRLGEDRYRVFSNNCEHFCEWCLYGEHRSYQVEALRSLPGRAVEACHRFIARLVLWPITMRWLERPASASLEMREYERSRAG